MKLAALIQDDQLQEQLSRRNQNGEELQFIHRPEELLRFVADHGADAVIVSDRFFDYTAYCDFAERLAETNKRMKCIVLLSNWHDVLLNDKFYKYSLASGFHVIHPGRTTVAVAAGINGLLSSDGDKNGVQHSPGQRRIALFMGTTPNVGTTLIAFGTAVQLARQTTASVGYLCLNLKSSKLHRYLGIDEPGVTLDHIRAELRSRSLKPDRLLQYCGQAKEVPNLKYLFGNMLREQAEYFTTEDIEHLLGVAREAFDVCVIDVSAYWDNAGTICGILEADNRMLVTTQDIGHFQEDGYRWLQTVAPVFGLHPHTFDVIVTQRERSQENTGIRARDVRKEMGMSVLAEVHRHPDMVALLNQGRLMELLLQEHSFGKELSGVAAMLVSLYELERREIAAKKPWLQRWLSGVSAT
ncbi:AAA family ATPase [Paenibacillus sp. y28]|uniref:AAA family ATPase n=1 Tax=Paenibacillus sp. y28 TaxID=3129110 RepID=UPI00301778C8